MECDLCGGRSANGVAYHKRGCATTFGGWSEAQRQGIEVIVARERRDAITEYEQQWEWIEEVDMTTPVRKGLKARPSVPHRDRSKYQRRTNVNIAADEDIDDEHDWKSFSCGEYGNDFRCRRCGQEIWIEGTGSFRGRGLPKKGCPGFLKESV